MSREITIMSTVWLEVLRSQRPMKYADITRALPELGHNERTRTLSCGYRLGYFARAGGRRQYEYSITPACTIPPGVPLVEVLEATT